jgi:hypothetical protein
MISAMAMVASRVPARPVRRSSLAVRDRMALLTVEPAPYEYVEYLRRAASSAAFQP